MNYLKIYNQIIERSKNENRQKEKDSYYEEHHILPKCKGGLDNKDNLILLTAREHFVCHWLLHLIYKDDYKIFLAFHMMCNVKSNNQNRYIPSSRIIEYSKIERSKRMSGDNNIKYWKGRKRQLPKLTQETKNKIAKSLKGVKHSEERIKKNSESHKGQIAWNKGLKLTDEQILFLKNRVITDETRKKMSNSRKGKIPVNKGKPAKRILCKYCNREIPISNYFQWHGDKCKLKND